ncbi:hypothetical protein BC826DRAFT_611753 [Russula brevipes]|nr:hypothetical protein BC826DRAFT_611753 [Russula brevipes]
MEVKAADENMRIEEDLRPRVDPQAFGAILSKVEPVAHAASRMHNSEPPPHSVLKRAVKPSEPTLHEHPRAPAATGELPKSSQDEGTRHATRSEDRMLTCTSEARCTPEPRTGDSPNPPACTRGAQLPRHQIVLIRCPKATIVRRGSLISTEARARAAARSRHYRGAGRLFPGVSSAQGGAKQVTIITQRAGCRLTNPQSRTSPSRSSWYAQCEAAWCTCRSSRRRRGSASDGQRHAPHTRRFLCS